MSDDLLKRADNCGTIPSIFLVRDLAARVRELEAELAVHRNRDADINDALRTILHDNIEGMERERIEHIADERDALRALLREARDDIACWGGYASEYFQQKHDLAGDLARIDAAIDQARKP